MRASGTCATTSSASTSTCCACRPGIPCATGTPTRSASWPSTTGGATRSSLQTLEEFLRQRGHVGETARSLYVHPNTLRQRLRRIEELTGLDAREADWLVLEVALKLQRLEEVYPPGAGTPR